MNDDVETITPTELLKEIKNNIIEVQDEELEKENKKCGNN